MDFENGKVDTKPDEHKGFFHKKMRTIRLYSLGIGCVCMCVGLIFTGLAVNLRKKEMGLEMERIYYSLQSELYETLQVQMGKLQVMEAHLIETDGEFGRFEPISARLLTDEAIRSFLFAPNGIVRGVFPMEGNEPVYGLDMNESGEGNLEAQNAIETGTLILAGPFQLVEGGIGICGRLPVYLENDIGEREYWGLVSVTLNFPEIFKNISMERIREQGYACEVWRINPDNNSRQVILSNSAKLLDENIEYHANFFNTTWSFSLSPIRPWYLEGNFWTGVFLSSVFGILGIYFAYASKKMKWMEREAANLRIRHLQQKLEKEEALQLFSQIRSHFFYHTLNTLQGLIIVNPTMAVKMVENFARFLRFNANMSVNTQELVSFKEEIRATKAYAQINEAQLGNRLKVEFNIPDVNFKIPYLTIEPLVENAILHGIKPKVEGGSVKVELSEDEDFWYVCVEDDGVGFDPEMALKESQNVHADDGEKSPAIGLKNIRKRLDRFEGCGINIRSRQGVGTEITLFFTKKGLRPRIIS